MGLLVYPVFRSAIPTAQTRTTGEFLAGEFQTLDEIAEDYGLTPVTAFADQREVPPDFDGPPEDLDEILGPCEDWFPPQEGTRALLALAKLIRQRPEAAQRLETPNAVIEELEDLSRQLGIAAKEGTLFRLEIS